MTDVAALLLEEALRSAVGAKATFYEYDRSKHAPMSIVLEEAATQAKREFRVYWVDDGPPEVFSLPGLRPSAIAFSSTYLALTARLRQLILLPADMATKEDVAERLALELIGEFGLRYGNKDFAAIAFAKSCIGKGIHILGHDVDLVVQDLETWPINEAYVATWFYGLAHELGHLPQDQNEPQQGLPDATMIEAVELCLRQFGAIEPELGAHIIELAKTSGTSSVIGLAQLRSEVVADAFAARVTLAATVRLMQMTARPFSVERYAQEMIIFLNIVTLLERFRRLAMSGATFVTGGAVHLENILLQPVSMMVRGYLLRQRYLQPAIGVLISGRAEEPDLAAASDLIDRVQQGLHATIKAIDRGVERAVEFTLFAERRPNEFRLLDDLRDQLQRGYKGDVEAFCERARSLGADSVLLRSLQKIARDPAAPVHLEPRGHPLYLVPWVEGSSGLSQPFGLDTRHGHVVFVFTEDGELFKRFFDTSATALASGYKLLTTMFATLDDHQLRRLLAERVSKQKRRLTIAIQGSQEFDELMIQLANDTIW
jgi:hypothetical protein